MKKVKEFVTLVRDIIMIIGIPVVLVYAYTIHQEQIETKNANIEFLDYQLKASKELQADRMLVKLKAQKEFYELEFQEFETEIQEYETDKKTSEILYDSILNIINKQILVEHILKEINYNKSESNKKNNKLIVKRKYLMQRTRLRHLNLSIQLKILELESLKQEFDTVI